MSAFDEIGGGGIQLGVDCLRGYIKALPDTPGVYRMVDEHGTVLYVGKAKALKKRVSSYTHVGRLSIRLQRMVAATRAMEFVYTHTEAEALLLESNLIKRLKPKYNILLRDDKSFPYILMTGDHDFPQIVKHRGAKKRKGDYYGPFAGAGDVNRTIVMLQRVFMLRNCTDSYFSARSRPCLQYHIKRCTAPCVGLVSKEEYAEQIGEAKDFLDGRSAQLQRRFAKAMAEAAERQDYEAAAVYRDRIKALSAIQARQDINIEGVSDADIHVIVQKEGRTCVQVFFFRAGRNYGNRSYFPRHSPEEVVEDIFSAFLAQFYANKVPPKSIFVNELPSEKELLEEALSKDFKVSISAPQRGVKRRALDFVKRNAEAALLSHIAAARNESVHLKSVAEIFKMEEEPSRIEVYDNSHISGTNMVGAMIVAGPEGFEKSAYRKFNIKEADASDDYGMMREVLGRRFKRLIAEEGRGEVGGAFPDLLLIDGGAGQLSTVKEVLEELGVLDRLTLVAISKGVDRNAGREEFHMVGRDSFRLPLNDPTLHYLQRLRDEAHRFAIGAHRSRRSKQISDSPLDEVAGIGAKRKKALLASFGSAKAVAGAAVEDLERVDGISRAVAQKIYDHFH